jgi:hypothetical protein
MNFHIIDGKTIYIVEDRHFNSLLKCFSYYTHKIRSNVKLIVIDKFHLINLISPSLNKTIIKSNKKNYNIKKFITY